VVVEGVVSSLGDRRSGPVPQLNHLNSHDREALPSALAGYESQCQNVRGNTRGEARGEGNVGQKGGVYDGIENEEGYRRRLVITCDDGRSRAGWWATETFRSLVQSNLS
jgi:hypothetical protein